MRLERLWIDGFKNLNKFELDFTDKEGITVLIGNNGSGKSNVLEAISEIFATLYSQKKASFYYNLVYVIDDNHIEIVHKKVQRTVYKFYKNDKPINLETLQHYLPSKVIALYSGEEVRLWENYYQEFYISFTKSFRLNQEYKEQKLFYIDGDYWNEALLALYYSELDDNLMFIKDVLKIDHFNEFNMKLNMKLIQKYNDNVLIPFLQALNPDGKESISLNDEDLKDIYYVTGDYEKDFFNKLIIATSLGLIEKINISFNDKLSTEDLSEGEKKQILLRAVFEIIADEKSLILLDEPDSSIHVSNKQKIINILDRYDNRNTILTTHSPTLTHHFNDNNIVMINNGEIEDKTKQEIFSHILDGIWNYQEQSIFLSSTKDIILLVEGKHDKIHIEEAYERFKDIYPELNFDIFQMNGELNIKHMVLGLANNGVDFSDKKIISIFDNDKAGKDSFNKNFKKIDGKDYKKLVDNNGNKSEIFFGLILPKKKNFQNDFTIENMYSGEKFKNALSTAFEKRGRNDFFENFVDEISKQIKDDAKNILADNCREFNDVDFNHFKKLFDLIKEIKDL